jgi:hypothetical protein
VEESAKSGGGARSCAVRGRSPHLRTRRLEIVTRCGVCCTVGGTYPARSQGSHRFREGRRHRYSFSERINAWGGACEQVRTQAPCLSLLTRACSCRGGSLEPARAAGARSSLLVPRGLARACSCRGGSLEPAQHPSRRGVASPVPLHAGSETGEACRREDDSGSLRAALYE